MAKRLDGKVAIITGGGTGIGAATAVLYAQEGAKVVICGRRKEPLEEVVTAIAKQGGKAQCASVDVADETAFTALIQRTAQENGRLDVLVNNAFSMVGGMLAQMSTADWHACFRVSVDAAFFGIRAALPLMAKQGGGSIINVASVVGLRGAPSMGGYGAAKAALINLTRAAAAEGALAKVRVNTIAPGVIATPATNAALPDETIRKAVASLVPLGRLGDPEEVAQVLLFLGSEMSSYVTGVCLPVDGGKTCILDSGSMLDAFSAT